MLLPREMNCLKQIALILNCVRQLKGQEKSQLNRSMGGEGNCNQKDDPQNQTVKFSKKSVISTYSGLISVYSNITKQTKTENPAQVLFLK